MIYCSKFRERGTEIMNPVIIPWKRDRLSDRNFTAWLPVLILIIGSLVAGTGAD